MADLWLTFASILATFHIGKARDNSGKEIAISDEYEDSLGTSSEQATVLHPSL